MADKYEDQLRDEVARLNSLALRSIDPYIVVKSVAASDPNVQELLLKRLENGERLAEVVAMSSDGDQVLVFFPTFRGSEIHFVRNYPDEL